MTKFFHSLDSNIAIVGAGIGGAALAAILTKKGVTNFTLYEGAKLATLKDRGAGIGLPTPFVTKQQAEGLLPADFHSLHTIGRRFFAADPENKWGCEIWAQPLDMQACAWGTLHRALMANVSGDHVQDAMKITDVVNTDQGARLIAGEQQTKIVDSVVWCDGMHSVGREKVFAEVEASMHYENYVAWRGTLDTTDMHAEEIEHFKATVDYYCYDRGHCVVYLIPSDNGKEKLNWVFYEKVSAEELDELGLTTEKNWHRLPEQTEAHLDKLIKGVMPSAVADIFLRTPHKFVQPIYSAAAQQFLKQDTQTKHLILGDAARVYKPHVASGSYMAMSQAIGIAELFSNANVSIQEGLNLAKTQLAVSNETATLADRMSEWLVHSPPDWQTVYNRRIRSTVGASISRFALVCYFCKPYSFSIILILM